MLLCLVATELFSAAPNLTAPRAKQSQPPTPQQVIEGRARPIAYTASPQEMAAVPVPPSVPGGQTTLSSPIPAPAMGGLTTQTRQAQDTGGGELLGIVPGKTAIHELSSHPIFSKPIGQETVAPFTVMTFKVADIPDLASIQLYVREGIVEGMIVNFASPRTLMDARTSFADVIQGILPLTLLDSNGSFREVYPEKGFAFVLEKNPETPEIPSSNVTQIAIETVQPEYFLIRASQNLLRNSYERSLSQVCADAETVLKLQPKSAQAHGLLAQAAFLLEEYEVARYQLQEAIALDGPAAQYALFRLNIFDQADQGEEGLEYLQAHRDVCEGTPFSKAETAILEGDFLRTRFEPNFDGAIQLHRSAVDQFLPMSKDPSQGTEVLAKRLLIRAYLALALDIVQKPWPEPSDAEKAFLWIETAEKLSDELSSGEMTPVDVVPIDGILNIALAASEVGLFLPESDKIDPYIRRVMNIGEITSEQVSDSLGLQAIYWSCAKFYRNCWNIAEMRGDEESSVTYARLTLKYLEPFCNEAPDRVADVFGPIDYDLAAIFLGHPECEKMMLKCRERAIRAIEEREKSNTLFENGENGIRLVNFGKAYWLEGDRQKGYDLTRRGIDLIDASIAGSAMEPDELIVPLRNAAMMAKGLHNSEDAALYTEQANKLAEPVGEPVAVPDEEDGAAKSARTASVQKKAPTVTKSTPKGPGMTAPGKPAEAAAGKPFKEAVMPWEREDQGQASNDPNRIPLTALISKKPKKEK